ncbi:serine/threonine protein kinase, partial [Cyclobacteriaceae bacterium]|nr:serine/threonine protein kinase [Cyclobacteriaceae bacterium]
LGSYVNDKGAVAEGVLLGWLEQMATAMDYAHSEKVVHRDIKPSNFFLTKKGQVKIMDFGIAKQEENMMGTRTDSKMGSVIYMSPEQIQSPKYVDYKTDIYSLGVALYHLSTGNIPYDIGTESEFAVMSSITQKSLPDLTDKNSRINAIIQAATQKDPKGRPNKVVDLLSVKSQISDATVIETNDPQKEKPQEIIVSDDTIIEQTENSGVENVSPVIEEDKPIISKTEIKAATSEKENTIKTENKGINKAVLIIPVLLILGGGLFVNHQMGNQRLDSAIEKQADKTDDLVLFKANLEIAQKFMMTFTGDTDFDLYASMIHDKVTHTSPMYGVGEGGKDQMLDQGKFYMNGFKNVTFVDAVWLPAIDNTTLKANGGVIVYGTWKGQSKETGKSFAYSAYHWMEIKDNKIFAAGDFFDLTGLLLAIYAD